MRTLRKIALSAAVCLAAAGCREVPGYFGGGRLLAKVGDAQLRLGELERAMPERMDEADSLAFAGLYIDRWVRKQVKLQAAEERYLEWADDIDQLVEEYRQSLLIRKLEQQTVDERIDTLFTQQEISAYYRAHTGDFRLERPLVKGRILRFPSRTRAAAKLRESIAARTPEKRQDLADFCLKNGYALEEFDSWTDLSDFAASLPLRRVGEHTELLQPGKVQTLGDNESSYLFVVTEALRAGDTAPEEYVQATIRRILFNRRRAEVVRCAEEELLEAARERGDLRVYESVKTRNQI